MTAALAHTVGPALRRRADAARRHPALEGRHGDRLAAHDPALPWPPTPRTPSTYGLSPDEIRREAERLLASGWQTWEIVDTLAPPAMAA
jgi:hypothetical protein